MANISNSTNNTLVKGSGSADSITNTGSKVTIDALGGKDTINNSGDNISIDAGTDNDYVISTGSSVTIVGNNGADSIYSNGSNVAINSSSGNDYVSIGTASKVSVIGGDGNDTIENDASTATLHGGIGNDSIGNWGNNVVINGMKGNDIIELAGGAGVTINTYDGDDTISVVKSAIDSFTVQNFNKGDEIQFDLMINNLSSVKNGAAADNVTINGLTLSNVSSKWSLKSGVATYYETYSAGATLDEDAIVYRTAGSSSLFTIGNVATTSGLSVDTRYNSVTVAAKSLNKQTVTISSGYDLELADDVTLTEIKDTWVNSGTNYAYQTNATTAGYDLTDNKITYVKAAAGTTVVELGGLKSAPTLSESTVTLSADNFYLNASVVSNAGKYSFDLDEGNYSLKSFSGTASADTVRNFGSSISVAGGAGKDYLHNESNTSRVTLSGGADNDTLENDSRYATLDGGAGNDSINNISDNVLISGGVGNDFIENTGEKVTIAGGTGVDTISNRSDNVSISGGEGSDSIYNDGSNVTISGGADNDSIENSTNSANILFQYSGGNDIIEGFNETSTLQLTSDTITSAYSDGTDAFLTIGNNIVTIKGLSFFTNVINVMDAKGKTSSYTINLLKGTNAADNLPNDNSNLTIQALGGDDTVENTGNNVTISGGVGNDSISNTGSEVSINGGAGNNEIDFNGGAGFTVNTGEGNDSIYVSDSIASFKVENFNANDAIQFPTDIKKISSISGGIAADNVTITGLDASDTIPQWSFKNNKATYSEKYTAGAILSEDSKAITYKAESTSNLFTINGVISTVGIDVNGNEVTVSKSALGKGTVSISGDYTLALGEDVPEWSEAPESWQITGTSAIYRDVATVAGYELVDNMINYVAAVDGKTLIELSGVSLPDDGAGVLSSNTIALTAENFAGNVAVVSNAGGYDFELSSDDYSGKKFSGTANGNYIYNNGSNILINSGAGSDTITNNAEENSTVNTGAGDDFIDNYSDSAIIISGAGNDSIYNNRENVTINPGAGNDTLEIYGYKTLLQYNSGDGNDIINGYNGADISIDLVSGTFGGYSSVEENLVLQIDKNSLTFQNADNELVSLKTATGNNYVWNSSTSIMIDAGEGNNAINNKGYYATVNSGAGNDTVTLSGDEYNFNTFAYTAGSGKDVIYNFLNSDVIKIADDSKYTVTANKNDVVLKVGKGSITLKDAAKNNTTVEITNANDETLSADTYNTAGTIHDNNLIELWETFKGTYTATGDITTIDGSKTKNKINIIGNESGYNELIGGKKNDTLTGSVSDDTLTGGKGSDIFVYTGGSDIITDYTKKDKISIGGESLAIEGYAIDDDNNLILDFGGSDALTITDGAGKAINFIENRKTTTNIYETFGTFDKKRKSVNLNGEENTFSAAKYSKLKTIDASSVMDYMEITGNAKANLITASDIGSTLNGKKGKDTLVGAQDVTDYFIYENKSGKDVIENYGSEDVISLSPDITIRDAKIKSNSAFIKFKGGALTVKDNAIVTLTSDDKETIFNNGIFITDDSAKVYGSYKGTLDLSNLVDYNVVNVDASEGKKKLTIIGDDSANSLLGGKGKDSLTGGAGDDSLWGGKGNDTLTGGDGNDTFIYQAGQGNDLITDYAADELLTILDKRGNEGTFTKATFKDDTLTLAVKGGGKVLVSGIESSTTVNINGTSRTARQWTR